MIILRCKKCSAEYPIPNQIIFVRCELCETNSFEIIETPDESEEEE